MELSQILAIARRQWWLLLTGLLAGLVAGYLALQILPKSYQANADVFVSTRGATTADQLLSANTFAQQRAKVYATTVRTPMVLEPAAAAVKLPGGAPALEPKVTAAVALDSVVINLSVRDGDPLQAQRLAEAVTRQLTTAVAELEPGNPSPVQLTVIRPAARPTEPISPAPRNAFLIGGLAGLVLAWPVAVLVDRHRNGPSRFFPERRAAQPMS